MTSDHCPDHHSTNAVTKEVRRLDTIRRLGLPLAAVASAAISFGVTAATDNGSIEQRVGSAIPNIIATGVAAMGYSRLRDQYNMLALEQGGKLNDTDIKSFVSPFAAATTTQLINFQATIDAPNSPTPLPDQITSTVFAVAVTGSAMLFAVHGTGHAARQQLER